MNSADESRRGNKLISEKSPYLQQHACNPVDWYPWGAEAFERSRRENKLIFLSIGYSTCHWCHVMERESFENPDVAKLLNQDFISIKVDREERPDIDHIYMSAVQAMTGAGGWPLNVFLTPEAQPITGGTYFPPHDKWGRPGMTTILPRLADLWKTEPEKMRSAGLEMAQLINAQSGAAASSSVDYPALMEKAAGQFKSNFDSLYGGFGGAPKFPRSHDLSFLLRVCRRNQDASALQMVEKTLTAMSRGGIYDHLGGGFSRYATDEKWLIPHFEKMLYDQAILSRTYLEACHCLKKEAYAQTARDIFRYVLNEMTSPEGAFYSAEDADSEGEEGRFYVWRPDEIRGVLGVNDGDFFIKYYGVTDSGNFEHGTSILNRPLEAAEGDADPKLQERLLEMRSRLYQARKKRVPPLKDDKVLTAWNGMMISSLAYGGCVLNDSAYLEAAVRAADFVLKHLQKDGRLLRRWRLGESAGLGFQDDYAFLSNALLDLYEATFQGRFLTEAIRLTSEMIRLFWDDKDGGFFYTASDNELLIARTKEYYDGAVPSGNSVAALVLLRLWKMTGKDDYEQKWELLRACNHTALARHPAAHPQMLNALDFAAGPVKEVVLTGELGEASCEKMRRAVWELFDPNRVVLFNPASRSAVSVPDEIRWVTDKKMVNESASVYICEDRTCRLPISDLEDLKNRLVMK